MDDVLQECRARRSAKLAVIDMSLIEASLGYSRDKRAIQHQAALDLERSGRQLRGESSTR